MSEPRFRFSQSTALRTAPAPAVYGEWSDGAVRAPSVRERKGLSVLDGYGSTESTLMASGTYTSIFGRLLTPMQLWDIYRTTPAVRAAIDSISRRISTWDWAVEVDKTTPEGEREEYTKVAEHCRRFFESPTQDGGLASTWQEYQTITTLDLLILDQEATELPPDPQTGGILELNPLAGAGILPVVDKLGRLKEYRQYEAGIDQSWTGTENFVIFEPNDVVYMRLYPTSMSPLGLPIIETLLNEICALLVASDLVVSSLDGDEIPPGILILGGLAREAARRAKADLRQTKGQPQKLKVITNEGGAGAVTAEWIELQRSLKESGYTEIAATIEARIFRGFGVLPIEMGSEDATRAHADAQLDVSQSHLLQPILELKQAKMNMRILPRVVRSYYPVGSAGDRQAEETTKYLSFEFDVDQKLRTRELRDKAMAIGGLVDRGVFTRNEGREEFGRLPIDGGEIATVTVGKSLMPVNLIGKDEVVTDPSGEKTPTDDGGAADDPQKGGDEKGPGETKKPEADKEKEVVHSHPHPHLRKLPSEWPESDRLKGTRTMDVEVLGAVISRYADDALTEVGRAQEVAMAVAASVYRPGTLTGDFANLLTARLSTVVDELVVRWKMAVSRHYREAARLGMEAARAHTGDLVARDWSASADRYEDSAMGYLTAPDGPIEAVRENIRKVIRAVTLKERSIIARWAKRASDDDLDPESEAAAVIAGIGAAFGRESFRVDNYSGRLVELANTVMMEGIREDASNEWWVEWVMVGDDRTCTVCFEEGSRGWLPAGMLDRRPGGDTPCGARCRCSLVFWLKSEIDDGTAFLLSPLT